MGERPRTAEEDSAPALALDGVVKSFHTRNGLVTAVAGVSVTITPGEVVALLGANGAGKTTLLDLVCGLTTSSAGAVTVFGVPPRRAVAQGHLAAVLQTGGLLGDLSVRETAELVASLFDRPNRVEAVLAEARLIEVQRTRVSRCSGGEQQRLKYALALIPDPRLLVLDEPTAGMDIAGRSDFWAQMRRQAGRGTTILYATHHLDEVVGFARRVVLLDHGRIVTDIDVATALGSSTVRIVRASLSTPQEAEHAAAALSQLSDVREAAVDGHRVRVITGCTASDEVARRLLNAHAATNVTIEAEPAEAALSRLLQPGR